MKVRVTLQWILNKRLFALLHGLSLATSNLDILDYILDTI